MSDSGSVLEFDSPQEVSAVPTYAPILVVDDEPSIRDSLTDIFSDEGFETITACDGFEALRILGEQPVSLVLLDIWMPGLDGLETLRRVLEMQPETPVIMMSGHATIATAVEATKIGARDFIEKPLDLHATLESVRLALDKGHPRSADQDHFQQEGKGDAVLDPLLTQRIDAGRLNRRVFLDWRWRGERVLQKTLAKSALVYGQGLHSGQKSGLMLEPLPPDSGIHFIGVSSKTPVPSHVSFVESTGFATTLRLEGTQVGTIEHLLSALHAYGITNLLVKCNGEVPVLDGSANGFCELIDESGVVEQSGDWFALRIPETIRIGDEREFIQMEPCETFSVRYILDYPAPLGRQEREFSLTSLESYRREIAPCRTFGFVKDIGFLQRQGLAQGGRFDNFVLYGESGAINSELRFEDEAVRHKILDAIGDLYLLGRPIQGRVVASMTGHSDNVALLQEIVRRMSNTQG